MSTGPPQGPGARDVALTTPSPPLRRALLAAFFAALGASLTTPVSDPDFWWHLASGRWMWERGELLRADPFAFTSALFPPSGSASFAFAQYWVADLLFQGVHAGAGLAGIVLLRAAVFTLMFILLYRLLRALGAGTLGALLLVALACRAIVHDLGYIGDRPQMWSSLLFVAVMLLCRRQREGRRWAFLAVPPVMLIWSNLHGGYLLGLLVVWLSAAADWSFGRRSRRSPLSAVAALLLSGCNPGGFSALLSYPVFRVSGSGILGKVVEEESLLTWFGLAASPRLVPALTAVLALSLLALLPRLLALAREHPDLLALYTVTLAMGASAARFLIFFVVVAAAATAAGAAGLLQAAWARWPGLAAGGRAAAAHAAALTLTLVVLTAGLAGAAARTSALRPGFIFHHPYEGVADFLEESGVRGNLFNEYGAGGYLAWRLFPSLRIFIYGRALSSDLLERYETLLLSPSEPVDGAPRYRRELAALEVAAIALPSCNTTSGLILPLAVVVARDEDWALVYADATAVVLIDRKTAPAHLLSRSLPQTALYDNMAAIAEGTGRTGHGRAMPAWRYSLAFALYAKGERAAALSMLDEYLRLVPGHEAAWRVRERIVRELDGGEGIEPK